MISSLATYTLLSPNCSSRQGQRVCKFTPHYMGGNCTVETCGEIFQPESRQASSNYGIGSDGRIACYVDENYRAWTSSSGWNDRQAITVEVANTDDYGTVTQAAWDSLVELGADVCRRYGFRLEYTGDADGTLTEHRMFASTDCPGEYLHSQMGALAREVNAKLDGTDQREDDMTQEQAEQLAAIYGQATCTDDPTGRGMTGSTPAQRVAWLGKKTDDILADLADLKQAVADLAQAVAALKADGGEAQEA